MRQQEHLRRICVTPADRLLEFDLRVCCKDADLETVRAMGLEFCIFNKDRGVALAYPLQGFSENGHAQVLLDDAFLNKPDGIYEYTMGTCDKVHQRGQVELRCPRAGFGDGHVTTKKGDPALFEPDGEFEGECP